MLSQDDFNSWEFNEATSKAVNHVQYSHSSAPMEGSGGTGNSYLICVCETEHWNELLCYTSARVYKGCNLYWSFLDELQL